MDRLALTLRQRGRLRGADHFSAGRIKVEKQECPCMKGKDHYLLGMALGGEDEDGHVLLVVHFDG